MSRFYGPLEANALLPDLVTVLTRLREERDDLVGVRDAFRSRESALVEDLVDGLAAPDRPGIDQPVDDDPDSLAGGDGDDPELRRLRLRMRGIVDQMQADVAWLDERGIVLRDIATGLLDFPAMAAGRPVWLCWRLGEDEVAFWHGTGEGFASRKPLAALPDGAARA